MLSALVPVVVYFFDDRDQASPFINELEQLAKACGDTVKFVIIDANRLFSLVEDAEIQHCPTVFIVQNRSIIMRLERDITIERLQMELDAIKRRAIQWHA